MKHFLLTITARSLSPMLRAFFSFGLVLLGGWFGSALADDLPPDASDNPVAEPIVESRVLQLVEQLGDSRRSVRLNALRTLRAEGPQVLPLLPEPAAVLNPRARETLRSLRAELDRLAARQALDATTVTLSGTFVLEDLLAELSRQTGNRVVGELADTATDPLAVRWEQTPFWEAIDSLRDHFDLGISPVAVGRGLKLFRRGTESKPLAITHAGPLELELRSIREQPGFGTGPRSLYRASFTLRTEPRMRAMVLFLPMANWSLTLADARLSPLTPEARVELPIPSGTATDFEMVFIGRSGLDHRTATIRYGFNLLVAARVETIRFESPDDLPVVRRAGQTMVKLEIFDRSAAEQRADSILRTVVSVIYPEGGAAFESHRVRSLSDGISVRSGSRTIPPLRTSALLETSGTVWTSSAFSLPEGETESPTLIVPVPHTLTVLPWEGTISAAPLSPD